MFRSNFTLNSSDTLDNLASSVSVSCLLSTFLSYFFLLLCISFFFLSFKYYGFLSFLLTVLALLLKSFFYEMFQGSESMPENSNFLDPAFYSDLPIYNVQSQCSQNPISSVPINISSIQMQQGICYLCTYTIFVACHLLKRFS